MCGIVAMFAHGRNAPPVSRDELLRIRDSMADRGPDGAGEWFGGDGRVALGHRRLAVIDLSAAGAQPMASSDGTHVISFNGEIYNYRELRAGLERQGCRFRSDSDTEVILHLYAREGAAMLRRLRGMFAFVLWDSRRQGMLLARDPLGIKPLYYTDDGTFRAASQVKALIAGGAVSTAPSAAGCVSFFLLGYVAGPFTIRERIRALLPGHSLWIDAAGPHEPSPFFSLRDELLSAQESASAQSPEERSAHLCDSLGDSIKAHLVADVPVGVFLSAGLDSTSIAALASTQTGSLRTVTLGFSEYRGTDQDEVPLAEQVARTIAADHRTLWVGRDDFLNKEPQFFTAMDQPTIDGVNTFFVSRAAADCGLKVALSGVGGDELFGGYPGFQQIPKLAKILAPFHHLPAIGRTVRMIASPLIQARISPKFAGLLEYGTSIEDAYLLRRALYMPWELPQVLDPDLVKEGWSQLRPLLSLQECTAGLRNDRARIALLEMSWYMRCQLLRDADWASMAHSIEVRTPLVDVELLRRLSHLLFSTPALSKREMAMATPIRAVPSVINRAKTGFTVPVREWLIERRGKAAHEHGFRGWAKHVFQQQMAGA